MEIKNAIIKETMLGYEGHGILTFNITVGYGGSSFQNLGGYALGGDYTSKVIKGILDTVGVNSWEELDGQHVRVKIVDQRISEIGNYLDDQWFNPKMK